MHTFPTVTVCVACKEPDAVTLLGAADDGEGVESWLRKKRGTAEAIEYFIDPANAGKV